MVKPGVFRAFFVLVEKSGSPKAKLLTGVPLSTTRAVCFLLNKRDTL